MSRSGYVDDLCSEDQWAFIRWRGAVKSALRGKRGQAFLREMLATLDALPDKRLIDSELEQDGEVCAIGAVGKARGVNIAEIDPYDRDLIAETLKIPYSLTCEVFYENDECGPYDETPEQRYIRMRSWAERNIKEE